MKLNKAVREDTARMLVPQVVATTAVRQLAHVDYSIATRISSLASDIVPWAFHHDMPWLAVATIRSVESLDSLGNVLIQLVAWLVVHAAY